ncbi:acyltransferase family protein [Sphingomonas naphthae]|uniref:Acyltransferase family protein n=1 Tax=Sphingomonas naphthae TaxID=1813468 RepID=A0ABY7TNV5_9SPHN|nr:acyltransferase family protein [Sphingomonas naphthae]WCT73539.1 acyltransferase family protein [Sphingomonas naphthae]
MADTAKARVLWADVARGIGILLVVIGHVWQDSEPWLMAAIYAFHMPLFFLLSGYFTHPRATLGDDIGHRARTLLVPYACYILLIGGALLAVHVLRRDWQGVADIAFVLIYGGAKLTAHMGAFWFVTCLFLAQAFYLALLHWFGSPRSPGLIAILLVGLALGYGAGRLGWPGPWNVAVAPVAAVFLWIGHRLRLADPSPRRVVSGALLLALVPLATLPLGMVYDLNMKVALYGPPILGLMLATGLSLLLIEASKVMERSARLATTLSALGDAALTILFLHQAVHYALVSADAPLWLQFLLSLALPFTLHRLFLRFHLSRVLLLGRGRLRRG